MFEFANPSAFLLLLPLVWAVRRVYGRNVTGGIRFVDYVAARNPQYCYVSLIHEDVAAS